MESCIGYITHYYNKIGVAVLSLTSPLKVHDTIQILGNSTDFLQKVNSLEIDHQKILSAGPEVEVALKVDGPVRKGDKIFLMTGDILQEEGAERFW